MVVYEFFQAFLDLPLDLYISSRGKENLTRIQVFNAIAK